MKIQNEIVHLHRQNITYNSKYTNMQIANPIYDTVFKYMMSDSKVAKMLLSAIIGEPIVKLAFTSKEYIIRKDVDKSKIDKTLEQLTVCHFDFNATIKTESGYKTVLIELQKAKLATDIMRFRRYLGTMYQDPENTYDENREKARQIYCVYFLNYEIGLSDSPIIKVDYRVKDLATGVELKNKSEFIKSLNHISWIVQVRQLKEKRRNELEELLSVFDQQNTTGNQHFLEIDENQYPKKYRLIIRKLVEAFATQRVRDEMQLEDDFLSVLLRKDALLAQKEEVITKQGEELVKKDEELTIYKEELAKKDELISRLLKEQKSM